MFLVGVPSPLKRDQTSRELTLECLVVGDLPYLNKPYKPMPCVHSQPAQAFGVDGKPSVRLFKGVVENTSACSQCLWKVMSQKIDFVFDDLIA